MSYCRFGWDGSNVYVFGTSRGEVEGLECCGCLLDRELAGPGDFFVETEAEMVDHLLEHRVAGHTVPQYAIDRLEGRPGDVDPIEQMRRNPQMFGKTEEEMEDMIARVQERLGSHEARSPESDN